eukprot:15319702-Alexandrium_andersonii.AAC.1
MVSPAMCSMASCALTVHSMLRHVVSGTGSTMSQGMPLDSSCNVLMVFSRLSRCSCQTAFESCTAPGGRVEAPDQAEQGTSNRNNASQVSRPPTVWPRPRRD